MSNASELEGKARTSATCETPASKTEVVGTDTYIAEASPGSSQSSPVWRCQKLDANGNVTWADGNANFDNIATDLTLLTYS